MQPSVQTFVLHFLSFNNRGRQIPFTLTIEANNESDARAVGERMTDVMDWSLQLVEART